MLNSSGTPLRVALLSISPHNRAILEFFFAAAGKQLFRATTLEDAEVLIIDFDHPGAENEWNSRADTSKPGIILSVRETRANNAIWVPKPLTSQALFRAAEQIRPLIPGKPSASEDREPAYAGNDTAVRQTTTAGPTAQPFGVSSQLRKQRPTLLFSFSDDEELAVPLTRPAPAEPPAKPAEQVAKSPEPVIQEQETEKTADGFLAVKEISTPEKNQEEAERRWKLLCGEREDMDPASWQDSMLRYTPENYFQNNFMDALKLARQSGQPVQLKIDSHAFVCLMPATNLAYSSTGITSDSFATLCNTPMQPGRVQLHIPSTTELGTLESRMQDDPEHTYDLEALIWTISLLTSHGRLHRNADANQRLALKHWPNLTRIEPIPHVMRIAAAWQHRPGSMFELANWLDIPQRYVIAFYCAASTLGLLVVDQGKAQYKESEAPKKNRGLFSRLLKRLLGGGAK